MKANIVALYFLIAISLAFNAYNYFHFREEIRLTDNWVGVIHQAVEYIAGDQLDRNSF